MYRVNSTMKRFWFSSLMIVAGAVQFEPNGVPPSSGYPLDGVVDARS